MNRRVMVVEDDDEQYHELRATTGPDGGPRAVCGTAGSSSHVVSRLNVRGTRPCRRCATALGHV
jgi:hypothetical protein